MMVKAVKKKGTTKATGRNYRSEYDNYQGTAKQRANRSSRNKARRVVAKSKGVGVKSLNGDVAHKNGSPKSNKRSNLTVQSKSKNRSYDRTKSARKKNPRS